MNQVTTDPPTVTRNPTWSGPRPSPVKLAVLGAALVWLAAAAVATQPIDGKVLDPDASWIVSLPYQWEHGLMSGRDFAFTYGPLSQLLSWGAVKLHVADDPLSSMGLQLAFFKVIGVALLGALLLMIDDLDGPRCVVVLAVVWLTGIPVAFTSYRPLALLTVAGCAAWAVASRSRRYRWGWACAAGVLCFLSQLLTAELLVYGVMGVLSFLALDAILPRLAARWPGHELGGPSLRETGSVAVVFVGVTATMNVILEVVFLATGHGSYRPFQYFRSLVETIRGYAETMTVGWVLGQDSTVGLVLLITGTGIVIVWRRLRSPRFSDRMMLSWAAASTLFLKSSLVRSDLGHLALGMAPWILVIATAYVVWIRSLRSAATASLALALLVAVGPVARFSVWRDAWLVIQHIERPRAQFSRLRWFRLTPRQIVPPAVLDRNSSATRPLAIVPYQNQIVVAMGRPLVAPSLQAYAAHTAVQQRWFTDGLERAGESLEVVWALDDVASYRIDGVQTTARLPLIFEYLVTHFHDTATTPDSSGYLLLERRESPTQLRRVSISTNPSHDASSPGRQVVAAESSCGVVAIDVVAEFPLSAKILQPADLWVRFMRNNVEVAATRVVPIRGSGRWETIVSVAPPAAVGDLFRDSVPRSEWDTVITETRPGLFGIAPRRFEVLATSCLEIGPTDVAARDVESDF